MNENKHIEIPSKGVTSRWLKEMPRACFTRQKQNKMAIVMSLNFLFCTLVLNVGLKTQNGRDQQLKNKACRYRLSHPPVLC